eukprot:scaffold61621_cov31-Tisochrysis_lutea.AAC.3
MYRVRRVLRTGAAAVLPARGTAWPAAPFERGCAALDPSPSQSSSLPDASSLDALLLKLSSNSSLQLSSPRPLMQAVGTRALRADATGLQERSGKAAPRGGESLGVPAGELSGELTPHAGEPSDDALPRVVVESFGELFGEVAPQAGEPRGEERLRDMFEVRAPLVVSVTGVVSPSSVDGSAPAPLLRGLCAAPSCLPASTHELLSAPTSSSLDVSSVPSL